MAFLAGGYYVAIKRQQKRKSQTPGAGSATIGDSGARAAAAAAKSTAENGSDMLTVVSRKDDTFEVTNPAYLTRNPSFTVEPSPFSRMQAASSFNSISDGHHGRFDYHAASLPESVTSAGGYAAYMTTSPQMIPKASPFIGGGNRGYIPTKARELVIDKPPHNYSQSDVWL